MMMENGLSDNQIKSYLASIGHLLDDSSFKDGDDFFRVILVNHHDREKMFSKIADSLGRRNIRKMSGEVGIIGSIVVKFVKRGQTVTPLSEDNLTPESLAMYGEIITEEGEHFCKIEVRPDLYLVVSTVKSLSYVGLLEHGKYIALRYVSNFGELRELFKCLTGGRRLEIKN